ncbi:MAG: glycosyltransferase, partial [Odoribacter sp.]|nr:glycosyltransferase [Odoribacter sp.]
HKSSIFALTSRYEGFGLVITEAMNCGVPPVVYSCKCGPKDIIQNGKNGFLVEANNKKEFIHKLTLLMNNENLRKEIGKAAKERSEDFHADIIMQKWIKLFHSLTEKEAKNLFLSEPEKQNREKRENQHQSSNFKISCNS